MDSSKRHFKDAVYAQLARAGKTLSNPKRIELLDLLAQGPRTVESLAEEASTTVANASQHLQVLFAARFVDARKEGRFVSYRLADQSVAEFLRAFRILAESRLAEIERIRRQFFERDGLEAVDQETLLRRIQQGKVVVLDVRPSQEFSHAHLSGALSIPLSDLGNRFKELPRNREIVAYCRGPYCVLAADAVRSLRAHGFRAQRLEASVHDLRAAGLKVVGRQESRVATSGSPLTRRTSDFSREEAL